jgi:hypothetical protein
MINRVPESEHGLCPASDDEDGDDLNLTEEHVFGPYQMMILLIFPPRNVPGKREG